MHFCASLVFSRMPTLDLDCFWISGIGFGFLLDRIGSAIQRSSLARDGDGARNMDECGDGGEDGDRNEARDGAREKVVDGDEDGDEENSGNCQPNVCNCPYDASLTPDLSQCFKNNQEICLTVKFLEIEMTVSTNDTDYQILVEQLLNDLRTLSQVTLGPKIRFRDIVVIDVPDNAVCNFFFSSLGTDFKIAKNPLVKLFISSSFYN